MNQLCDNIIHSIILYLSNIDSVNFIKSSKYINKVGNKFGFLKYITFNHNNGYIMERFYKHYRTIKSLQLFCVRDPHLWIPSDWPEKVFLHNCKLPCVFDLAILKLKPTKNIIIHFYTDRYTYKIIDTSNTFNIQSKDPNHITAYNKIHLNI